MRAPTQDTIAVPLSLELDFYLFSLVVADSRLLQEYVCPCFKDYSDSTPVELENKQMRCR
jgi:hypothetical protein